MMWQNYLMEKTLRLDFLALCLDPTQVINKEKKVYISYTAQYGKNIQKNVMNLLWK